MNDPFPIPGAARKGSAPVARAVYFGGDATNPTSILRITSLLAAGVDVTAFTFRRSKFNVGFQPAWPNIHLGHTTDRRYLARLLPLLRAALVILRKRSVLGGADFLYARMIDAAVLALFAKWVSGSKATLVYEVEDVQAVFFKRTLAGAVMRWIERRLLARTGLLVVMSPGFLRGYFAPVQRYAGASFVLENKLQLDHPPPPVLPSAQPWSRITDKWVIGWFGTLRCQRSMQILSEIAERLGDRVQIYTRGYPTETGLAAYQEIVDRHSNWIYEGEYTIPRDLEEMYGRVHFSWCLDFLDAGGNSELLLACRMYQGGFYGAVPLVVAGTEMERFLAPHRIGHAFRAPFADAIVRFLTTLSPEQYRQERARVTALGPELFLETGSDVTRLLAAIGAARRP